MHSLYSRYYVCLIAIFIMVSMPSYAYDFESGGIYYNINDDRNSVSVTSGNYYKGNIDIPSKVVYGGKTYNVSSIDPWAFMSCYDLTSITIPNSVTSIGHRAFSYCTGLTSIKVDSRNNCYDSRDNCNALIETKTNQLIRGCVNSVIPNTVTSIGEFAFESCYNLTSVIIPSSVTSIGVGAFGDCSGLKSITISNNNTTIGGGAFNGTAWFDNQPDGLVYVGKYAYQYKGTMPENTEIIIKDGTIGISSCAFNGYMNLKSIKIPSSVTNIGNGAFSNCGITSVTIPNSVTSIEEATFYHCENLTYVIIPNSVTSIGELSFYECYELISIITEIQQPFEISESVFSDYTYNYARLCVPVGATSAYDSAAGWNKFNTINVFDGTIHKGITQKLLEDILQTEYKYNEIINSYENLLSQIDKIGNNMAKDRVFVPEHKYAFANLFDNIYSYLDDYDKEWNELYIMLSKRIETEDLSKEQIYEIIQKYENELNDYHLSIIDRMQPNNTYSPLYTFPHYLQTGTFTCNDGGYIKVGENIVVRNETKSLSSFHSNAFINIADTKFIPFNITIVADKGYRIKSLKVGNQESTETIFNSDFAGESFVVEFERAEQVIMGDANDDREVNVSDIVEVVNYIMNNASANFLKTNADLNGDGEVNVTDIVMMVNIIMSGQNSSVRRRDNNADNPTDGDYLTLAEIGEGCLALSLDNHGRYVASQFNLRLSKGQMLESITLNNERSRNHRIVYSQTGENHYKVIVYSLGNESIVGESGELMDINVVGSGNVCIDNILFVTDTCQKKTFWPLYSMTTGIDRVTSPEMVDIYGVDGRKVLNQAFDTKRLNKGVYIINGKKHIVK